jgi:transposase
LVNELGLPLDFMITAGQISDYTPAVELLGEREAKAVIPPRSNRKQQRDYDRTLYKLRNRIERCFSKLKHFRRFATRYEKSKICFQALVALACSAIALNLIVDTA